MKLTTLRQPSGYYFNGKSASTKFSRTFVVPVVASVAENQQRVQVVLQRAPKSPVRRTRRSTAFRLRLQSISVTPKKEDVAGAEAFGLHFALQYECAITEGEEEKRNAGNPAGPQDHEEISAAVDLAVKRVQRAFQQGGRLRSSPQREGKVEHVALMTNRVTAHSRAIGLVTPTAPSAGVAPSPQKVVNFGPSTPTAAASGQPSSGGEALPPNSDGQKNEQDHHNLQNRFDTNEAAPLGVQQLLSFERKGWLSVRQLFSREEVEHIHKAILPALEERELEALQQRIRVLCPGVDPYAVNCKESAHSILAQKSVEPLGFLQFFNLNKYIPLVKELACSKRLASMAASLLGCDKVRLYQDCVFLKHAGYALTNWHSDLRMTPLDTNQFVTVWIPLRPIKGPGDTGLIFAGGSHKDFAMLFWYNDFTKMDLKKRGYDIASAGKMEWGDVTWHHGWTLHSSPPQPQHTPPRVALAITYFADGAKIRHTEGAHLRPGAHDSEDLESYQDWLVEVEPGSVADHALLPIVHP